MREFGHIRLSRLYSSPFISHPVHSFSYTSNFHHVFPPRRDRLEMENSVDKPWNDRTTDTGDVKEIFSRVRSNSPIPSDIVNKAHFLCSHYLGGAWKSCSIDRFSIKQITGGMSNLLFLVQLCDSLSLKHSEPRRALLRIHCQSDIDQLLSESVVFTLLSERKLGPRLLGVFPGGRFEEYIPSRPLNCLEISECRFVTKIGPMLARVHSLEVPIRKEPQLINRMQGWINKWAAYDSSSKGIDMKCTKAIVHPSKYPTHLSIDDLNAEVEFVDRFLNIIHSPIIFSHNDLQEGNILVIEKEAGDTEEEDNLALIDFEYCDYNYRGFDLGNHMCEYGLDYASDEHPYYLVYPEKLDMEEERRRFCSSYIHELYEMETRGIPIPCGLISGDKDKDIVKVEIEASLFMPISHLFWSTWALVNAEQSSIAFGYAEYGRDRLAMYFDGKTKMEEYMRSYQ
ncbi:cka-1 [Pristionchus pacificus]|nr:cka-1 [Pristionchus pacificus]